MVRESTKANNVAEIHSAGDPAEQQGFVAKETCNLVLLAAHQIAFRVGWIFKTETVIIPAFLDHVAGAGWIRGFLPVLSRLGQSITPLFLAGYIDRLPRKKLALVAFVVLMGLTFAVLAGVWTALHGNVVAWMPWFFLALYFLFFVFYGLYQVSFGATQGKLIRPTRRGSLILMSTFWGTPPAILAAWVLLPRWLEKPELGYGRIFATTAVCFLLSAFVALWVWEPSGRGSDRSFSARKSAGEALVLFARDANLRWLVLTGVLFGLGLMLGPHYQALARERLGLAGRHLMVWAITQSVAVGIFSLFVGPMADRRGNRLTLRVLLFASSVAPALAVLMAVLPQQASAKVFWLVYVPLGMAPLVLRTLLNYALEICEPARHAQYQSVVILGVACPFVVSPLIGWLIDQVGFEQMFALGAAAIFLAGVTTFRLEEPRYPQPPGRIPRAESPE